MKFRAHDTFFIRKGWLYKGIKNVIADKYVFMGINENPMDVLGIGSNMVKSLRYWLQATGLTIEPTSGKKSQTLTKFGDIVYENDKYIEELGTLWLLHYKLASNKNEATAWYYFFNIFNQIEFNKEDYIIGLENYISLNNVDEKSIRILTDDFNCIVNTYISRLKVNPEKIHPENNIDCPLGELDLLDIVNRKEKIYKKKIPKIDSINPMIALAIIVDNIADINEIKISSILNDECNLGKVFNLDIISLITLLNKLEIMEYIKVNRTAGLDVIKLNKKIQGNTNEEKFLWCVAEYYKIINN